MNNSKYKMKLHEFLEEHVQYYQRTDVAIGVTGVQERTINGKKYVELLCGEDLTSGLELSELEKLLQAQDQTLYVVMIDPNGWSGKHEFVTGSSGGSDKITYHCSDD